MPHRQIITYTIFLCVVFASCADRFKPYKSAYHFRSVDKKPRYDDLDFWAAHPWKWDPSDSTPVPLRHEPRDTSVDVFFLHPTTHTQHRRKNLSNAEIDDAYVNAKTDYSSILYQASVFNQHARVFAPRYRQTHISNFYETDKEKASRAFDLAYFDIKTAFQYYLDHWNNGRPIIIAAHSQGSLMAERLLKDFFENKPLYKQLVVAYTPGWAIPKEFFSALPVCQDATQTGCICSWRTVRNGFVPGYVKSENGNSYVTNPLNWGATDVYVPRTMSKGSVLYNFNKIYPHSIDGKIRDGLLFVRKPKFPGSFLYFKRNYHIGDINLFYMDIRVNVADRIKRYLSTK